MATLLQVAQRLGDLTVAKAPEKTRKLKNKLKTANTGRKILGGMNSAQAEKAIIEDLKSGTYTFEMQIDVGPQGAEYGVFWNDPSTDKSRTRHRPEFNFADQAYNDPGFQAMFNEYIDTLTDKVAASIAKAIDKELK